MTGTANKGTNDDNYKDGDCSAGYLRHHQQQQQHKQDRGEVLQQFRRTARYRANEQ